VERDAERVLIGVGLLAAASQGLTEPATAAMRAAWALLERQWPFALGAFVVVQCLLLATLLVSRSRREGATSAPPGWLWTALPFVLVTLVALPALRGALESPTVQEPLRVRAVGHQWWWEFRYPDLGVVTATDLHLPLGRPVEITLESADVLHSFWVPALGPQQEVSPDAASVFTVTPDREGEYPGQCALLCGTSHAHMRMRTLVTAPEAFDAWVAAQLAPPREPDPVTEPARAAGRAHYLRNACRGCHVIRGTSEGPVGPDLTHFASRGSIGGGMLSRSDADLKRWLLHANELKPGSTMPGFKDIPPRQLEELVRYLQGLE
jgi:cytochrome c oxidase subunit 2